jgi:hypothetical protein
LRALGSVTGNDGLCTLRDLARRALTSVELPGKATFAPPSLDGGLRPFCRCPDQIERDSEQVGFGGYAATATVGLWDPAEIIPSCGDCVFGDVLIGDFLLAEEAEDRRVEPSEMIAPIVPKFISHAHPA